MGNIQNNGTISATGTTPTAAPASDNGPDNGYEMWLKFGGEGTRENYEQWLKQNGQ